MSKLTGFVKAHWKEFLALTLAAIPAALLILHKPTQKAAANAITYIPATFGAAGAAAGDTSTTSAATDGTGTASNPASALTSLLGRIGVTQSPPNTPGPRGAQQSCPPGYHWVPASGPAPGSGMLFASRAGHCAPDVQARRRARWLPPSPAPANTTPANATRTSVNGSTGLNVPPPRGGRLRPWR